MTGFDVAPAAVTASAAAAASATDLHEGLLSRIDLAQIESCLPGSNSAAATAAAVEQWLACLADVIEGGRSFASAADASVRGFTAVDHARARSFGAVASRFGSDLTSPR